MELLSDDFHYFLDKPLGVERFYHILPDIVPRDFLPDFRFIMACDYDDGNVPGFSGRTELFQNVYSPSRWKPDVEENQIGAFLEGETQSLNSVKSIDHVVTGFGEFSD